MSGIREANAASSPEVVRLLHDFNCRARPAPVVAAVGAWAMAAAFPVAPARAGFRARGAWTRSIAVLVGVLAVEVVVTFATPLDGAVAFWIFIGISLIVATLREDAGCEAVAVANALGGCREPAGCVVYAPLDAFEARRRRSRAAGAAAPRA